MVHNLKSLKAQKIKVDWRHKKEMYFVSGWSSMKHGEDGIDY